MDLRLPPEVRPVWIEGVFTSEYERDTLPLLFASDRLFDEYYDALALKYPHVAVALDQIRARNVQARQQRADGLWQDCVESLGHCVHLRRCVFEETDFQYAAAQKHHILSMLNFATFFLKESGGQDAMLMRSFELFKAAEDAAKEVQNKGDRSFLLAAVHNNFASYFAKRKKFKAAAQRLAIGLRVWSTLNLHSYDLYFAVQRGSGEAWSNRFDDSYRLLRQAAAFAPGAKGGRDDAVAGGDGAPRAAEVDDDPNVAPVRFQIQMLNSGVPLLAASEIALHHNIAVALVGLRRYKDAAPWCAKAMELATAQSTFLKATHPIVVAVRRAQEFCDKTAFVTKFADFRMKHSEHQTEEYRRMQLVVHKTTTPQPAGGPKPPQSAPSGQQASRPKTQQQVEDERRTKEVVSGATKHPNSAQAAHAYFPRTAPRVSRPSQAEALRMYLRNYSERQLVEEFGIEGSASRKRAPKPPPKKDDASREEKQQQQQQQTEAAASPAKSDASPRSERARSPPSSRSRSPYTSDNSRSRSPYSTPPDSSRDPSPQKVVASDKPAEKAAEPAVAEKPAEKATEPAPAEKPAEKAAEKPVDAAPVVPTPPVPVKPALNDTYGDDDFEADSPTASPEKKNPPVVKEAEPATQQPTVPTEPIPSAESPTKAPSATPAPPPAVNNSTASVSERYADDTFEAETPVKAVDASRTQQSVNESRDTQGYGDDFENDD